MKLDSQTLFNFMFKLGEEAVIILEDESFHWGKIDYVGQNFICLKRPNGKKEELSWDEMSFMAHDGFPVAKLRASNSDEFIGELQHLLIPDKVREKAKIRTIRVKSEPVNDNDLKLLISHSLDREMCHECKKKVVSENPTRSGLCGVCARAYAREQGAIVYHDPYRIEEVTFSLFNEGNNSSYFNHVDDTYIETLVMHSKDGALGLLWEVDWISEFEPRPT